MSTALMPCLNVIYPDSTGVGSFIPLLRLTEVAYATGAPLNVDGKRIPRYLHADQRVLISDGSFVYPASVAVDAGDGHPIGFLVAGEGWPVGEPLL